MTENIARLNQYWSQPLDSLTAALHSTPGGLAMADAQQRLGQFGPNVLEAREKATTHGSRDDWHLTSNHPRSLTDIAEVPRR